MQGSLPLRDGSGAGGEGHQTWQTRASSDRIEVAATIHEGMEPTNNSVEREIRYPVIHCKIRGQIGSTGKMARFVILHTCIMMWRKQN